MQIGKTMVKHLILLVFIKSNQILHTKLIISLLKGNEKKVNATKRRIKNPSRATLRLINPLQLTLVEGFLFGTGFVTDFHKTPLGFRPKSLKKFQGFGILLNIKTTRQNRY